MRYAAKSLMGQGGASHNYLTGLNEVCLASTVTNLSKFRRVLANLAGGPIQNQRSRLLCRRRLPPHRGQKWRHYKQLKTREFGYPETLRNRKVSGCRSECRFWQRCGPSPSSAESPVFHHGRQLEVNHETKPLPYCLSWREADGRLPQESLDPDVRVPNRHESRRTSS